MGFAGLFSTKSETTQYVQNKQIGQSGAGSFALSGDVGTSAGDINIVSNDPSIAIAAINASGQNQMRALETLQSVGERFAQVAEYSVSGAQETALNALPLTPEQIQASRGGLNADTVVKVVGVVAVGALLFLIIKKSKP